MHYLFKLRLQRGIRRSDLSTLIGYEQSSISALEIGLKGQLTPEFLSRLTEALSFTDDERRELELVSEASQRKLVRPRQIRRPQKRLTRRTATTADHPWIENARRVGTSLGD